MYTSDTKKYGKIALIYLMIAIFCALFGAVYEHFSFGVYSYFMLYAFAFPLIGGALPSLLISLCDKAFTPWKLSEWLYHSSIATLTVGSIIRGVLDIYGTTNQLIQWYWYAGAALIAAAMLLCLIKILCKRA